MSGISQVRMGGHRRAAAPAALAALAGIAAAGAIAASGAMAADENPFDAPVLDVRPRIFIRAGDFDGLTIAKIRQALGTPEWAGIRGRWRGRPLGRAVEWMLDGKKEDLEAAASGLAGMDAGGGTWSDRGIELMEMAALLDWLWPALDEKARAEAVRKVERGADAAADHVRKGEAPFFYSRTPGALAGLAIAGLALHGASPKAGEYLGLFRQAGVEEYFRAYGWVDGAATGASYTMFYTYYDLPAICAAWWSATGRNPAPWIRDHGGDWLEGIIRFYLWSMRPGFAFTDINDLFRGVWESHDQFCRGLDIAAYVTRSGLGRAWSQRWLGRFGPALYHPEYAHGWIFRDPTIAPRPFQEMPLAALFGRESCGYGFFRSGWPGEGRPDDATHVFFRFGDPMDVHGGVSAGEFQVFRHAPLAARGGRYSNYDSPPDQYHRNCLSTNVVLFTDPAVPKDRGDQNTRRGLKTDHRTWAEWLQIRERSGLDVATILDWKVGDGEARCRADLGRAVPASKCRTWIRELVWLARKHLVVLDIVETARPEIRRQWQLHLPAAPEIGPGARMLAVANAAPDRKWADEALRPRPDRSRLFVRTLAPAEYTVIRHGGGAAEAFGPDGRSQGGVEGNPYHREFGKDVVQVDPGTASDRTVFLHILTAVDDDGASPQAPPATYRVIAPGKIEVTVEGATTEMAVPEWFRRP